MDAASMCCLPDVDVDAHRPCKQGVLHCVLWAEAWSMAAGDMCEAEGLRVVQEREREGARALDRDGWLVAVEQLSHSLAS